ncbi:hypothetical protein LX70_04000 [Defluviimonas denitrificans]|jgi:hypothetical protein|uniref:Tail tube GTA-gp10-like protein n=2 Tax=Albidovulum denitrificans TaxID=404881 RepID=A0A2S8RWG1_9RHOB|nr:hypothetical protein LX70_04000 [Defluviimonas denitrificans]
MASFFREIMIAWKGVDYPVTASMRLLQRIESRGISLPSMVTNILRGEAQTSHMAYALWVLLVSAGADGVTEEEIYAVLMGASPEEIGPLRDGLILALSPAEIDGKKTDASD